MKRMVFFLLSALITRPLFAEVKISFPDEELATETVLPTFEDRIAVKNRKVNHKGKFEFNLMAGMVASEPIYNPLTYGLSLAYHFDNTRALHVMGVLYADGLSDSGKSLKAGDVFNDDGTTTDISFDALRAPHKEYMVAAHYQYTAYYGKISITRDGIMNLTLSGLVGLGAYSMNGLIAPAFNLGISQRLYFGSRVALRFDILLSAYRGPVITSGGELSTNGQPGPDPEIFEKALQFDSNIYMGLSLLL